LRSSRRASVLIVGLVKSREETEPVRSIGRLAGNIIEIAFRSVGQLPTETKLDSGYAQNLKPRCATFVQTDVVCLCALPACIHARGVTAETDLPTVATLEECLTTWWAALNRCPMRWIMRSSMFYLEGNDKPYKQLLFYHYCSIKTR
jgi:hypothetical protein